MVKVLNEDATHVSFLYALCSISAPIPGAAFGSYIADKLANLYFDKLGWI